MDDTTQITLGGEPETTLINVEEHDKTGVVKVGAINPVRESIQTEERRWELHTRGKRSRVQTLVL